jgi:hypothetical protein
MLCPVVRGRCIGFSSLHALCSAHRAYLLEPIQPLVCRHSPELACHSRRTSWAIDGVLWKKLDSNMMCSSDETMFREATCCCTWNAWMYPYLRRQRALHVVRTPPRRSKLMRQTRRKSGAASQDLAVCINSNIPYIIRDKKTLPIHDISIQCDKITQYHAMSAQFIGNRTKSRS